MGFTRVKGTLKAIVPAELTWPGSELGWQQRDLLGIWKWGEAAATFIFSRSGWGSVQRLSRV